MTKLRMCDGYRATCHSMQMLLDGFEGTYERTEEVMNLFCTTAAGTALV